jgi:hypothetical protein
MSDTDLLNCFNRKNDSDVRAKVKIKLSLCLTKHHT